MYLEEQKKVEAAEKQKLEPRGSSPETPNPEAPDPEAPDPEVLDPEEPEITFDFDLAIDEKARWEYPVLKYRRTNDNTSTEEKKSVLLALPKTSRDFLLTLA